MQPARYQNSGGSRLLFFSEVLLVIACFYAAAYIDLAMDPTLFLLYEGGVERVLLVAGTVFLAMYFYHLYADVRVRSRVVLMQKLCEVFGLALVAQSLVGYAKPDWILPRWMMIYGAIFSLLAIFSWRVFYSKFVLNIVRRNRIMFVGRNGTIQELSTEIAGSPGWGYEVLGFVDDGAGDSAIGKWMGPRDNLVSLARKARPDKIVVGLEDRRNQTPIADLLELHYDGMAIEEASKTYETVNRRVCLRELDARDLIFSRDLTPAPQSLAAQRWMDMIVALAFLVVSLPVTVVLAVGLRLISKDPVFDRRPKAGWNGKVFQQLRFREPKSLHSIYRRLHLDAIPELINVIRGEMAMTGPRADSPELREERSRDVPLYDYRYNVRPGMTGWAQINLSQRQQIEEPALALEYDLYYVKHRSVALNTYILMTTLKNRLVWADQPA